jgi:hypothetical protein
MKRSRYLWLAISVVGCQNATEKSTPPSSTPQPPSGSASSAYQVVLSPFVHSGQTNVDLQALVPFGYGASALNHTNTATIEQHAYFVNEAGSRTAAKVVAVPPKQPTDDASLQLVAASPLAPDAWHWIVIDQDKNIRVAGADIFTPWQARFFTGSAPRILGVQGSTTKNPDILNVTFSEPVDAATIDASSLVFVAGSSAAKCVLRGQTCMDRTQQFMTVSVPIKLNGAFAPGAIAFELSGSVMGSGRSVAEGAAKSGHSLVGDVVQLSLDSSYAFTGLVRA